MIRKIISGGQHPSELGLAFPLALQSQPVTRRVVKKRKYYKVQSEPILGKWQPCQNPQMSIFSPPVLSI